MTFNNNVSVPNTALYVFASTDFCMLMTFYKHCTVWTWIDHKQHELDPMGAQWLSGRVLDSRSRGCTFEPHRLHCVVVLEQDTFILA